MSKRFEVTWRSAGLAQEYIQAGGGDDTFATDGASGIASVRSPCERFSRASLKTSSARVVRAVIASLLMAALGGSAVADQSETMQAQFANGSAEILFSSHKFSAACFDTLKCRVLYSSRYVVDKSTPSISLTDPIRRNLDGTWGGIANFPPPAHVTWVAKDGTPLEAQIDIGEIFRDQLVRYAPDLNARELDLDRHQYPPGIVLVVDNRTISVYMRATVFLIQPRDAANPYSNLRSDLVLAFAKNY